jgi:hypothetical protein
MLRQSFFLISAALLLAAHAAQAQESESGSRAEIQLSNDTLQMRYMADGERVNVGSNSRASALFFMSEERDVVLGGDLLFPADVGFTPLDIHFGPRAYAALLDDENNDVMALSLGAEARFTLDRRSGLAIAGHAFYAPDIVTFGSADNLTDLGARVEIRATPRLLVFGGMRWFEFDLTDGTGERTLQEEVFVGAGWRF